MSTRRRPARSGADGNENVRIHSDLRERGIAEELRDAFAERLAPISASGSPENYAAALDAVVLAYRNGAPAAPSAPSAPAGPASLNELQRLMTGFTGELRKLEEAMRTLDAYVTRMRSQTDVPEDHRLH
jgi:hypothetical protein